MHDQHCLAAELSAELCDRADNEFDLSAFVVRCHNYHRSTQLLCLMTYKLTYTVCIVGAFQDCDFVLCLPGTNQLSACSILYMTVHDTL